MTKKKQYIKSGAKTLQRDKYAMLIAKGVDYKEAYIKAGFSKNSVNTEAHRLKENHDVKNAILYYKSKQQKPLDISSKGILAQVSNLAYFNIQDLFDSETGEIIPIHLLPRHVAACIKDMKRKEILGKDREVLRIEYEYRTYDKTPFIERLKEYKEKLIEDNVKSSMENNTNTVNIKINGIDMPIIKKEDKKDNNDERE